MIPPTPDEYAAEIRRLEALYGHCEMQLSFLQVMAIIGGLQLALRPPQFPATSKQRLTEGIWQRAPQWPSPETRPAQIPTFPRAISHIFSSISLSCSPRLAVSFWHISCPFFFE